MSKKPAAMPIFGDAYLADTTHLSTEEHGAYLLLMMAAWLQDACTLPLDDRKLARITGLSTRKWCAVKKTILEFWTVENGRLVHSGRCAQPIERITLSPLVKRAVLDRDGAACVYCNSTEGPFEFDHIFPWSRGGLDTVDNLCVACMACNRAKGDRTPAEIGWTQ